MELDRLERLLSRNIGLNPASIGHGEVRRSVETRMRGVSIGDADAYYERLAGEPEELGELIELLLFPVTWFFREPNSFAVLRARADGVRRERRNRPLRILSIPCATGEEPYSAAITVREAGLPHD